MADVRVMYKEAFRCFAEGDYDAAITGFGQVVELDPSFSLAFQGMAEAYGRKEQFEEAVAAIEKAIEAEPDEPLYLTSLSRFFQRLGRLTEAEAAAAEAQRLQAQRMQAQTSR
jgi:tetratricopeptide (TPR) repeat protein